MSPAGPTAWSPSTRTLRGQLRAEILEGEEYPFLICTFWLVEQYAHRGRVDDAERLLAQLVGYAGDLGLLSEEYDPDTGRLAGNFPQAFSHLGLIRATDAVREERAKHER